MQTRRRLDISRTLYDSDGYRHCLIQATPAQILTLLEGFYWLWDRASGKCLVEGMQGTRLSNTPPSDELLRVERARLQERRALQIAQLAMNKAALSAAAHGEQRRTADDPTT